MREDDPRRPGRTMHRQSALGSSFSEPPTGRGTRVPVPEAAVTPRGERGARTTAPPNQQAALPAGDSVDPERAVEGFADLGRVSGASAPGGLPSPDGSNPALAGQDAAKPKPARGQPGRRGRGDGEGLEPDAAGPQTDEERAATAERERQGRFRPIAGQG